MCNFGIFTTPVYSSPSVFESPSDTWKTVKHVWQVVFYRTLRNTGIFITRDTFRTLSNIYDGKFYPQPYVTVAYLETWHIQNTAKHLSQNILFKTLCNPDIFRTLVYSEIKAYSDLCPVSKMEHFNKIPV